MGYTLRICSSSSSKVTVGNGHLNSKIIVSTILWLVLFVDGHILMPTVALELVLLMLCTCII